ncbi:M20/M25/M40 family metallo-hydrolase [Cloacibacillus evryensis]|uniref:M20/M25/M40 family metallo-hydrolase n=1 Tax=Cloacibacillus evryensis TaxID=508460 RepID=UPI00044AC626|nr:M20/M25/M40 family metallo-hydrolase [Cloacibacillus evryensis]EXG78030.1 putative aminopeptidase [Cloacibacillus evryensis DSM 19522]MEA5034060.1 M28 family peptidase [Cloacibacillus evryensis]
MSKLLRQIVFLVLMGVLVAVSGGCGGGSDSKYPVVNADGAILPKDPTNWTAAEKSAWINQGTLLLDQMVSTEFRGRMAGDIGYEQAAMWAATNFKAWGLEPLDGSYFQDFNISYSMPINKSPVIKILVDGKVWKSTENGDYIDDEFVKDIMSAHGTNTGTVRSKLTFLGYGIDATAANVYANTEFKHINPATVYRNDFNEYAGLTWDSGSDPANDIPNKTLLDVADRVVIFRNATPNSLSNVDYRPTPILGGALEAEEYKYTVGNDWIRHDEHYVKIGVARQRKAAGVLYNQMVANPNIRYQPPVGDNVFQIALVGSIGRNTKDGTLSETTYTNGTGDSRLLNDLFAKQLEIEAASGGAKHTLTDLITRAKAVKSPNKDGNGPVRSVPMKNFGDGKGDVPDYPQFLYQATADLFKGPDSTVGALNSPYDKNYDASIATNSFNFDDRIEIEITTEAQSRVDAKAMNVVGVVRGSELPDEYVIYMTHFDHCGFVGPYMTAGAADNGGGSTANMIAARYAAMMAAAGNKPKRSLVFILDGAEESGMNGAKKAAAWFAANGREKVKAVFHTDATFGKGHGEITLSTSMSAGLAPLVDELLDSSQGRHHPWGQDASDVNPGATITMSTPTSTGQAKYVGRPRTDTAAWQDEDMPVVVNVSAREQDSTTSLYHAPYNDRDYVADRLLAILGIATANNMYTVANR